MTRATQDKLLLAAAGGGLLLGAALLGRRSGYDFREKVVLITGGSRGLGLELARELAGRGARVVICARDIDELDRAADDSGAVPMVCDVTDCAQVANMVERILDRYRRVDVVINNAGMIQVGPVEAMTPDDYRHAMDVHFWGPLYVVDAVLPHMRRAGGGRIANIASIGGKVPVPHLLPYTASKFALVGWSRGLRMELAKDNIVVTTVCPGLMRTGSPRNALFKSRNESEYAWFKLSDSTPLTAMHSRRAARQICEAVARGEAEIILTAQAKIAAKLDALFPELSAEAGGWANRLLPEYGGIGTASRTGAQSESAASSNPLTALGDRAARRNNEI